MTLDVEKLYALLPAVHRSRDALLGEPLKQLLGVIAEQAAVVEEGAAQLYDDAFIETCDDWAAAYIGGLIGYRPLHGVVEKVASPRAEVANTIAYRRRKGTALVMEQLAADVSGWPAAVVEYFQLVATAQHSNCIRPGHGVTLDLRNWEGLERLGTAFDPFARPVDVRAIRPGAGLHNLPNVGVTLWRLAAFRRRLSKAVPVDAQRHWFSPLGAPVQLFTKPESEETITHLATPLNVPEPISRRVLHERLSAYYGRHEDGALKSLEIEIDGVPIAIDDVESCNLADVAGGWAHVPSTPGKKVALDPVLGRIALPPDRLGDVTVTYHYGFSAQLGGGEYDRSTLFAQPTTERPLVTVPTLTHPTIQSGLDALPPTGGIVEVIGNGRFNEALTIVVGAGAAFELRAGNGFHPLLELAGELLITGGADARVTIDGLLVVGATVCVPDLPSNELASLSLRHVTFVPGHGLTDEGRPMSPGAVSLSVEAAGVKVQIDDSILGPIRLHEQATCRAKNVVVDAAASHPLDSLEGVAFAAPTAVEPAVDVGGTLSLEQCTVVGKVASFCLELVSNSLLHSRLADADMWVAPVIAERKQKGCMRFSYVPTGSLVPRRYRCQPQLAIDESVRRQEAKQGAPLTAAERAAIVVRETRRVKPSFTSLSYGKAAYAQLRERTPEVLLTGAEDESEMGAFHSLHTAQRDANVRIRLDEYTRFSLETGIFHQT
jgi:hypothetical protein